MECRNIGCALQFCAAFDVFHGVLHPFAHDERAAALNGHRAGKPGVATQLESGLVFHRHIHAGIGIVPVHGVQVAVLVSAGGGARAVNRMGAGQGDHALRDCQPAVCVGEVGVDAVQSPVATTLVINLQRAVPGVAERAFVDHVAAFPEGEGGVACAVGNQGFICQCIDGEPIACFPAGGVPVHAVAVQVEFASAVTEGEVPGYLCRIADDDPGTGIDQHIIGRVASLLIQIGGTGAAQVEQGVGITRAVDMQGSCACLAPFGHVVCGVRELQVHIHPIAHHIAGCVQLPAFTGDGETG